MPIHTTLAGERIRYPVPNRAMAAFLSQLDSAFWDSEVSNGEFFELLYRDTHPRRDRTIVPGRALVTKAVQENPVWSVMIDLARHKQDAAPSKQADPARLFTTRVGDAHWPVKADKVGGKGDLNAKGLPKRLLRQPLCVLKWTILDLNQ
jgi:hypothetical protein